MRQNWTTGNRLHLLENGEEYFPRLIAAVEAARESVLLETFIIFEDSVGQSLSRALIDAARRGVRVVMTVDGFGSADLSQPFVAALVEAGVTLNVFAPRRRLVGMRTNLFRRLHRKLVAVDGTTAFVGGINLSDQHLIASGPLAKQDYAVEVQGPIVREIQAFMEAAAQLPHGRQRRVRPPPVPRAAHPVGEGAALLVTRDNDQHRRDIERHYLMAIRAARRKVVIANAYFLPGYQLLQAICNASRRGVDVRLVVQGRPDMLWVKRAVDVLYAHLREAGVRIFEYCERPLHGKVALVDDDWATVGSSNLDPLSLSLNLEANLVIRDPAFVAELDQRLGTLMANCCTEVAGPSDADQTPWQALRTAVIFHFLRKFPSWAGWLPAHTPRLVVSTVETPAEWERPRPVPPGARQDCP
ncbi:cardiolipin synthase ClsB [Cupriavidus agavae]|uniref:Cardiolipin synthase B n=1 Tax=Cupriavidus agavae TaxID=1001822 RepID=A0A4Q7RG60_9BURK|nr:cardiolipin synthase ClsB [Cupriavidus agavae]RZT31388.1 cardiolipin synthase [Cupriavidus agavae]